MREHHQYGWSKVDVMVGGRSSCLKNMYVGSFYGSGVESSGSTDSELVTSSILGPNSVCLYSGF
jgi:hypothetical protein